MGRLVLSRHAGQRILVGNAWITVVGLNRGQVKISVEAPDEVKVVREELLPPEERKGLNSPSESGTIKSRSTALMA